MYLKNGDFPPTLMASSALTSIFNQYRPSYKKDSLDHYVSYATSVTYLPI